MIEFMRSARRGRPAVAVIAGALLVASCGSADDTGSDEASEASGEDEATDDAAADGVDDADAEDDAEAEDEAEPVAANEADCSDADTELGPGLPDVAESVEQTTGDLLGDGQPDQVTTYAIGSGDDAVYLLRVETSSGYVVEASLDDATSHAPVRPLGTASIGGTREVALVVETVGASAVNVGLWALHDFDEQPCALARVTIPDHTTEPTFAVGGTVGHASGLSCGDADGDGASELVVVTAESEDGESYDWSESAWRWPGAGELAHVGEEAGTESPEELDARMGLNCPSVDAP